MAKKKKKLPTYQTLTRRTRLQRSLTALEASSAQEEAAYWFLIRAEWAENGYRDPYLDPIRPIPAQEEAAPDELTWRLSRADTYAILRGFSDNYGEKYWNIAWLMIMGQASFGAIGLHYAPGTTPQHQTRKGHALCAEMLKNLTSWLAAHRKKIRSVR